MSTAILISALVLFVSCKEQPAQQDSKIAVNTWENTMKKNFNSFIVDGLNKKDIAKFKFISSENYNRILNGITVANNQNEMEANMNIFFTGFPDGKVTVNEIIIKDNHLFAQWEFTGTNIGIFGESPPTGKKVYISGYSTILFNAKGKMIQENVYYNELELLQQMGYSLKPPVLE